MPVIGQKKRASAVQHPGPKFNWKSKDGGLTLGQIKILKALEEAGERGMTRQEIDAIPGSSPIVENLGPKMVDDISVKDREHGRKSLLSLGMVRGEVDIAHTGNGSQVTYYLTDLGEEAANFFVLRERLVRDTTPKQLLIDAIKVFKPQRVYSFELYTEADLEELRVLLGKEHQGLDLETLRQRIINYRKQGLLADDKGNEWPGWYTYYREEDHWQSIEQQVLDLWENVCALNPSHRQVEVYHRRFTRPEGKNHVSILWEEVVMDCIPLCKECAKRSRKSLAPVPKFKP